jgi:hypothetical protein
MFYDKSCVKYGNVGPSIAFTTFFKECCYPKKYNRNLICIIKYYEKFKVLISEFVINWFFC